MIKVAWKALSADMEKRRDRIVSLIRYLISKISIETFNKYKAKLKERIRKTFSLIDYIWERITYENIHKYWEKKSSKMVSLYFEICRVFPLWVKKKIADTIDFIKKL